ncbi:MAG: RNA polymerase sigma factor [Pirellulales bacterium]
MPSTISGSTSSGLLERVRVRDADAWRRLARLYTPLVYRWARQSNLQASDAADVAQEVFTSVARSIEGFRHDHADSSFRGWLWTITRNHIRLHHRRGRQRPEARGGSTANLQLAEHVADDGPSEPTGFNAEASLVHRAVQLVRSDFQPQTWQAFWRVVVDGVPAVDVGAELGMTPAAVRQAKYRVLCRLQEELAED